MAEVFAVVAPNDDLLVEASSCDERITLTGGCGWLVTRDHPNRSHLTIRRYSRMPRPATPRRRKQILMHAIYERITVAGPEIVGVRLTAAAYTYGLALALPDKVVLARREDSNLRMPYLFPCRRRGPATG